MNSGQLCHVTANEGLTGLRVTPQDDKAKCYFVVRSIWSVRGNVATPGDQDTKRHGTLRTDAPHCHGRERPDGRAVGPGEEAS